MAEKKKGFIKKKINKYRLHWTSWETKILLGELLACQSSTHTQAGLGSGATAE